MNNRFINHKSLFASFENLDMSLGLEMISFQNNDPIVSELIDGISKIATNINDSVIRNSVDVFNDRSSYSIITSLEKSIYDRFGFRVKMVSDESRNFGIYTAPPSNYNVLNNDIRDNYERVKEYLDVTGMNSDVNPDKLKHSRDEMSVYNVWTKSLEAIESTMNLDSIKIDLNKAKITGLPKEYCLVMLCDIYFMIKELGLTTEELVAVIMHELGHGFTHIEYSYRTYNQTAVIVDTIKASVDKNTSYRKTLVMAYESAFKEKMDPKDSATTVGAVIKIANKYLDESRYLNSSNHSYTDSEQLADQFVGRFGLSKELFSALNKIGTSIYFKPWYLIARSTIPMILIYFVLFVILEGLVIAATLVGSMVLVTTIVFTTISAIYSIMTTGGTTEKLTYDDNKRRLQRVVNEGIRNIRTTNIDNKTKSLLIENISNIITTLDSLPEDKPGVLDSLFRFFMSSSKEHLDNKKLEQLIEDLQENRIHLAAAKIKDIL